MAFILMVDDEQDACRLMQRILSSLGHDVQAFTEGHRAIEWLHTHTPDLVFLDIKLRGAGGIRVLEFIKRHQPATKVIMITGTPSAETAGRALELGVDDTLVKPVEIHEIEERLNWMFGLKSPKEKEASG